MDKTDKPSAAAPLDFTSLSPEAAPFLYFDGVTTFGVNNGAIQIELVANMICPTEDGGTLTKVVQTAHLRCSPNAAAGLREALDKALEMVANAGVGAQAGKPEGKLN